MIVINKNKGFYSTIENLDKASYYSLRSILSYEDKAQVIARLMARKKLGYIPKHLKGWNGTVYLLDENGKYPTGLTEKVIEWLKDEGLQYNLIDNQVSDYIREELPIKGKIVLRPYQIDAMNAIKNNPRGMIQMGTGGGKTVVMVKTTQEIGAYPFLFVIHRLSLLDQTWKQYNEYFDVPIGYIGNGKIDVQKINIATIGTICSALKIKTKIEDKEKTTYTEEQLQQVRDLLKKCKFILCDELHHSASGTFQRVLKEVKNADYKYGVSATPYRTDGADIMLEASFGPVQYTKSASELIEEGFLTRPKIYFIKYSDPAREIKFPKNNKSKQYTTIYKECIVENEDYNMMVANLAILNADKNRSTLVSVKQVEHGKNILKAFSKYNHNYEVIFACGKDKKEFIDKTLLDFGNKKFLILISTLIDEGTSIDQIESVINAGGGASAIKAIQLTGRAMRLAPGKKFCYIYDFLHPYSFLFQNAKSRIEILSEESAFDIRKIEI